MNPTPLRLWYAAFIIIHAALPAINAIDPTLEHDTWWHLAVGQFVIEQGRVPAVDPFSRLSQETPTPWRAYSWLYEIAVCQIHAATGFPGLMVLRSLLVGGSTAIVFAYVFRRAGATPFGLIAATLTAAVLMMLAKERPWHVTVAFTTLTLWATQALRDGMPVRRALWLLPLFVLWANIHIQFVLGWGILGLACLFPARANRGQVVALTAGCFLATAVNPYHAELLEVIWEYATQAAPLKLVQELAPPDWHATSTICVTLLLATGALLALKKRPWDGFELLLLLTGAILAARMRRDIWFGALAGVSVFVPPLKRGEKSTTRLVVALVLATFAIIHITNAALFPVANYEAAQQKRFPYLAVEAIRNQNLPGPIFNEFDWGGYIIRQLPGRPVALDGRTNLYGSERMLRSFDTWSTPDGWRRDPDFLASRLVIAPRDRILTDTLREMPDNWRIAHEDELAVVFVRR